MLPLLKFYFQEEVRQAAVQCIPDLLRSAYLAAQKGMQGADANYVRRMVDFIWGPLVEAIGKVLIPYLLSSAGVLYPGPWGVWPGLACRGRRKWWGGAGPSSL